MAKNKATLPDDIAKLAQGEAEYVDRRAEPAPVRDYYVEEDPILAQGDSRAIASPAAAPAIEYDAAHPDPDAPRVIEGTSDMARLASAIEALAHRPAGPLTGDQRLMERLVAVMEKVANGQTVANTATADAIRKSQDPSNMFSPLVSVFNPRGERDHPRPQLRCRMFLPWEAEVESLTREEIELLNLLEPGEFYIKRNDDSRILITVKTTVNPNTGQYERLLMNSETGFNNDYHWLIPPMRVMLRQILAQRPKTKADAAAVRSMEDELSLIERFGVDFKEGEALLV